jgi:molybdate transport system substrate-binding protein
MKIKLFIFFCSFFIAVNICAEEIIWYVCAAFYSPAKEIVEKYNNFKQSDNVVIITGGTGELVNKILFAKKGDLFTPPCDFYKDFLIKKGLILRSESIAKQSPVFALSEIGEKKVTCFRDLSKENIKITLGNPKTMALGKIFLKIKRDNPVICQKIEKNTIIEAINILQIVTYLKMNIVDSGILFDSVAKLNKLKYIPLPFVKKYDFTASVNILKTTNCFSKSLHLFDFIHKNRKIFERYGFRALGLDRVGERGIR